jgi:hypothetical protein
MTMGTLETRQAMDRSIVMAHVASKLNVWFQEHQPRRKR